MSSTLIPTTRAQFRVVAVEQIDRLVWIEDLDGPVSVTNDAEAVVRQLIHPKLYPGHRLIYRDTMGNWDELCHDGRRFTGFAPARDMRPRGEPRI